ncbi:MAG: histidinol dehydrogenase, partial [Candidatus Caldarchaeum sp.]
MRFYRVNAKNVPEVAAEIVSVRKSFDHYVEVVRRVVEDVRARGDEALIEYVKKFDSPAIDMERLRVPVEKLADAYARLDDATKKALKKSSENIARVCKSQLKRLFSSVRVEEGVFVVQRPSPLSSVGCYVPGGGAAYPSTVLMTVVPAKVAEVPRIAVFTPPTHEGNIPTVVAAALYLTCVKEVYCAGGPHAIAAMAYGTETIKPVAKIIGPGGAY